MPPGTDPLDVNEVSMKDEGATMGAKALWGRSLAAIGENKVEMNQSSEAQYFKCEDSMRTPLLQLLLMSSLVRR